MQAETVIIIKAIKTIIIRKKAIKITSTENTLPASIHGNERIAKLSYFQ